MQAKISSKFLDSQMKNRNLRCRIWLEALQCVATRCSALQHVHVPYSTLQGEAVRCSVLCVGMRDLFAENLSWHECHFSIFIFQFSFYNFHFSFPQIRGYVGLS